MARKPARRAPAKPVAPRPTPKPDTARKIHVVKCWPSPFSAILGETMTAQLRHDDRGYKVGDDIVMREFTCSNGTEKFTRRELRVCITHALPHEELQALGLVSDAALRSQDDPEFRERAWTAAGPGIKTLSPDDSTVDRIVDAMRWAQSRLPDGGGKRLILMSIKLYPDSLRSG